MIVGSGMAAFGLSSPTGGAFRVGVDFDVLAFRMFLTLRGREVSFYIQRVLILTSKRVNFDERTFDSKLSNMNS